MNSGATAIKALLAFLLNDCLASIVGLVVRACLEVLVLGALVHAVALALVAHQVPVGGGTTCAGGEGN